MITLLVSPDDAQRLTLASTEGHIQLALRNPLDTKADDVPSSMRGLFKGMPVPASLPGWCVMRLRRKKRRTAFPTGVSIEVYQGDKKTETKCAEDGCETK